MSDITRPLPLTPNGTLTTADYCSDQVYEIERQRFFHGGWFLALFAPTRWRPAIERWSMWPARASCSPET